MQTVDMETKTLSTGIFPQADGSFLAMTLTQSKTLKTRKGALSSGWQRVATTQTGHGSFEVEDTEGDGEMGLIPIGYDGFEYVSDLKGKLLTDAELAEWHKGTYGNCQRCGGRYADPNPECPNPFDHDAETQINDY